VVALLKDGKVIGYPAQGKKHNEWFTPRVYIEAAREVMNGIDLDPASCELANRTVRASRYYTKEDDGLSKEWYGKIWLNPPFNKENGKSTIGKWSKKLVECFRLGIVEQAVLLGAGQTASAWFADIWNYPICFTNHHIRFYCPQLDKVSGQRDCTFMAYLGPHEQKFIDVFQRFGVIAKQVSPPKVQPRMLSLWEVAQ